MTTLARAAFVVIVIAAGVAGLAAEPRRGADDPRLVMLGACYCRAGGALYCTANLTEGECRRQCDVTLCDDWFWKERLPCWNWGYGG